MAKSKLRIIEFRPDDIGSAINKLDELNQKGELSGLLFVAKVKSKKRPVLGAAGCCSHDSMMTIGAAAYLLRAVTDMALNE